MAPPDPGEVQVWCSLLRCKPQVLSRLELVLSREERERAARFRTSELRDRFTLSRVVLRQILGGCLGVAPGRVDFTSDAKGKPRLAEEGGIDFNLAHTADLMVLAVTRGMEVGVDVERVRRLPDSYGIARRFFTPRESDWLQQQTGEELDRAFFNLWTRKEAVLKATGAGISGGLESIELLDHDRRFVPLVSHGEHGTMWALQALEPAEGFVAALALPSNTVPDKLRTASFEPA